MMSDIFVISFGEMMMSTILLLWYSRCQQCDSAYSVLYQLNRLNSPTQINNHAIDVTHYNVNWNAPTEVDHLFSNLRSYVMKHYYLNCDVCFVDIWKFPNVPLNDI